MRKTEVVRTVATAANQSAVVIDTLIGRLTDDGATCRHVRLKKWIVIQGVSGASDTPITSVQCYYEIKPDESDEQYQLLWRPPQIHGLLIPRLDVSTTASHQTLENALVDEGKRDPRRLTKALSHCVW